MVIRERLGRLLALLVLLLPLWVSSTPARAASGFTDFAFQQTWERTDKAVAEGQTSLSWYWGPQPRSAVKEAFGQVPGGERLVQYFDKSRMEINDPNGNRTDPFYVTNGLLAVELMTGRMQLGAQEFEALCPADIPLASDKDDDIGPTYAVFGRLMGEASDQKGRHATATVDRNAQIGDDPSQARMPGTAFVTYVPETKHNIPSIFWDFLSAKGTIYVDGHYTTGPLNTPWFYASGYPVTEPYWANVVINNQNQEVLIQAYQRRVLTYNPANPPAFQVEMGNVGLHYYDWRYKPDETGGSTNCLRSANFDDLQQGPDPNLLFQRSASYSTRDGDLFNIVVSGANPGPVDAYADRARFFIEVLPGQLPVTSDEGEPGGDPLGQPGLNNPEGLHIDIQVLRINQKPPYTIHVIVDPIINNNALHWYTITGVTPYRTVATIYALDGRVNASLHARSGGSPTNGTAVAGSPSAYLALGSGPRSGTFDLTTQGTSNQCLYRVTIYFNYLGN